MSKKFDEAYWRFVQTKFRARYNFQDLLPLLTRYVEWIKKHVSGTVRVLDIGCGFGYFLRLCDGQYWETYGLDISSYAIGKARENTKARLYIHDFEKTNKPIFIDNTFDLITMFDVIEHFTAPVVVLEECRKILKHGGRLVITTPNLNALERVFLRMIAKEKMWHGFYDKTHARLYTTFSLRDAIEKAGFRIIDLKTPFYFLPTATNNILGKMGIGGNIWLLAEKL